MSRFRRRLATWALALIAVQSAMVCAAPLSACCSARAAAASAAADHECCPAGSHPPGECPLHARSKAASRVSCRMQCDAPHGLQFLGGVIGMLPAPAATTIDVAVDAVRLPDAAAPILSGSIPDSPPPRLA